MSRSALFLSILLSLVLLLHLAYFGYQWAHERFYLLDSQEYVQEADNIRESGTFFSGDLQQQPLRIDHFTKRPPLYPLLLAAAQILLGHERWVIPLQLLLSLCNLWLVFRIGRLLGWGRTPYFLLAFLLIYPAQLIYANLIMTELLFQTEITLLLYTLLLAHRERRLRYFWATVLLLILSMLTKPIMYLFGLPLLVLWGIWAWHWRKPQIVLLALLPLLFVGGYCQWNASRTGYFHFSSIQNLSLLQYTTYNLLQVSYGPEIALQKADSILYASLAIPDYGRSQQYLQAACFSVIREHKVRYLGFHLKGMLNFFLDPGRFDLYHFFGWETVGGEGLQMAFSREGYGGVLTYLRGQPLGRLAWLLLIALGNALRLLALLCWPFERKVAFWDRMIVLLLVLYLAGLTGVSGASRFAVPLFPIMLVVSGTIFWRLGERWQHWRQSRNSRQ